MSKRRAPRPTGELIRVDTLYDILGKGALAKVEELTAFVSRIRLGEFDRWIFAKELEAQKQHLVYAPHLAHKHGVAPLCGDDWSKGKKGEHTADLDSAPFDDLQWCTSCLMHAVEELGE